MSCVTQESVDMFIEVMEAYIMPVDTLPTELNETQDLIDVTTTLWTW